MTGQTPERIIIGDKSRELYADPLYRLLASSRFRLAAFATGRSTACYRGYCGTWEIIDRRLYLVHLNLMGWSEEPVPHELRARLLRIAQCKDFPIPARWFNGTLRIRIGRRLVYSHHGWSNWFERERVVTIIGGDVQRDREVDTRAMLERCLRRNPHVHDVPGGSAQPSRSGPLVWFDDSEEDEEDWWPPDYVRRTTPHSP